jgi:voltage-gated sodium channel
LRYFRDPWNLFDVSIVTLCLLPLDSEAVIAIRIVRLLRIMRIFRALPKLRLLIRGMAHSISSVGYVAVLLLVHFYLFAVIGVSLFGSDDPRHFGNLGSAILTLFQVLTLENWPDVMAPVKAAHPLVGVFFFIGFIVTGTMVVMNLFVGVIVGGMSEAIQEDRKEDSIERKIADDVRDVREAFARMENKINAIEHRLRTAGDAEGERPGRGSKAPA